MNVHAGDLAVVVNGLWPNVGRIVYVDRFVPSRDFTPLGLGHRPGWRVRSWSQHPLETTAGPRMVGYTPRGSLRRLDPLPSELARQIDLDMALADFREAMGELAELLKRQQRAHSRRARTGRKTRKRAAIGSGTFTLELLAPATQ